MATVRELITTWGFKIDLKTLDRMDAKVGTLIKRTSNVGENIDRVSKSMVGFGTRMSAFVTLPIIAFGVATLKAAGNFEAGMNKVDALVTITSVSLQQLEDQARSLGETTKFSASQAADAIGFMAKAGLTSEQIFNAMPDALNLASAANIGLAETADLVTNVMAGMGIESDNLGNAVDVLTKAFISSNTDLSQLGQAMKFAGPVARGFGLDLETTTAILGLMGNAGIQASLAGTSLRGALVRLASPSKEASKILSKLRVTADDGRGGIRNLVDIIGDLSKAGITATQTMQVFGLRAGPAMSVLISQGDEKLRSFIKKLRNVGGVADRIAKKQLRGLNGAWITMKSALEGLSISIGKSGILKFFTDLVKSITSLVRWMSKINPELLKFTTIMLGIVAVIGPTILIFGLLGMSIVSITKAYILLKGVMIAAKTAQLAFTASMLIFPILATLLGVALGIIIDDFKNFFAGNKSLVGEWLGDWADTVDDFMALWDSVTLKVTDSIEFIMGIINKPFEAMDKLITKAKSLPGFLGIVGEAVGIGASGIGAITGGLSSDIGPSLVSAGGGTVNRSNIVTTHISMSIPEGTPEQQIAQVETAGRKVVKEEIDIILRRLKNDFPEVE